MTIIYNVAKEKDIEDILSTFEVSERLGWPTVLAKDGDQVKGFLSTQDLPDSVVAGPFRAESPLIALRLVQMYETILKGLGLSAYWFHVEHGNYRWLEIVRRAEGYEEIATTETGVWFKRNLRLH